MKLTVNIKLANPKFVSLHQELTPISTPRPNVKTNIINQIYTKRYKKYLYYRWWAHNVLGHSQVKRSAWIAKKRRRFPQVVAQHRLTYIPTTYTETQDITLQWKDFEEFYAFISHNRPWFEYVQQTIHALTNFLYSWFELRKVKGVLLVGLMYECPSPLRLGSRGV